MSHDLMRAGARGHLCHFSPNSCSALLQLSTCFQDNSQLTLDPSGRHSGDRVGRAAQAPVPSTEESHVPPLLHVHLPAQTVHRKYHPCHRITQLLPGEDTKEKQGEHPSQTLHSRRCRQAPGCAAFLQAMLKLLAEGGVRFLFPAIRHALWVRL